MLSRMVSGSLKTIGYCFKKYDTKKTGHNEVKNVSCFCKYLNIGNSQIQNDKSYDRTKFGFGHFAEF